MKKSILFVTLILFGASVGLAQKKMYEPKKGTAERNALMDAIRTYDVKRNAALADETFTVSALRVQDTWAYANVEQKLSDSIESYGVAHVFLQNTGGKWTVAFSTYNSRDELGAEGLDCLKKKNKSFPKALADFAMNYLAG